MGREDGQYEAGTDATAVNNLGLAQFQSFA